MRVLGVDLGSKRIGLAISDPEGSIAFPMQTLVARDRARDLIALCEIIEEHAVERAVVGLPLHMNGRRGPEAERAEEFAASLAEAAGIDVDTIDERWTTVEAERALRETGRKPSKSRDIVDSVAASILLRTYLDLHAGEFGDAPPVSGDSE